MTNKYYLQEISVNADNSIEWVELIRVGKFDDGFGSVIDISLDTLNSFKENFDNRTRRVDLAVDYFHNNFEEAAGWFQEVEVRDNSLFVKVEWTNTAKEKILSKEIRYISAEFSMSYIDDETGKKSGATLYGAGLTNRPHVKDMKPIFSEQNQTKGKTMDFQEILSSVGKLSDDEKMQLAEKLGANSNKKELSEATQKLSEYKQKNEASNLEIKKLSDSIVNVQKELEVNRKTSLFNELLHTGKVVEAQREAFMSNDMVKFSENAVAGINLDAKGTDANKAELTPDVAENTFNEKVESLTAKGMSYVAAFKQVSKENPELSKKVSE